LQRTALDAGAVRLVIVISEMTDETEQGQAGERIPQAGDPFKSNAEASNE
jgi:hypothetical protein